MDTTDTAPGAAEQTVTCSCSTGGAEAEASVDSAELRLQERVARIRHKIVVLSGKGGVGKSTVAVNLAVALAARGLRVGLLDVDVHGPSVPLMLGLTNSRPRNHAGALVPVQFSANLQVMSMGFLLDSRDDPVVWRGPMKHSAISQFLSEVEWGNLDYLVVDAPPGTGDEPLAVVQLLDGLDGAVIVTTPQEVALSDVRRCVGFCVLVGCRVLGVIENMSGFVCPHCGETLDVFGRGGGEALAVRAGVPFLGRIPVDPELVQAGDLGKPYMEDPSRSATAEAFQRAIEPLLALDDRGTLHSDTSTARTHGER
jgi:ATP-binding protein involved in chromosome partitioning